MALALLLRLVQHIAYGHGPHIPAGQQGFLQEVTAASDLCGSWRSVRVAQSRGSVGGCFIDLVRP